MTLAKPVKPKSLLNPKTVKRLIGRLECSQRLEDTRHAEHVADLKKQIKDLQQRCSHANRSYVPDPSGNSDSYYECVDCGINMSAWHRRRLYDGGGYDG